MFKSTFAKYMTAFITVLLISFIVLSSIITTTIRSSVSEDKKDMLAKTSSALSKHIFENFESESLEERISSETFMTSIYPLVSRDNINVVITDSDGKVLFVAESPSESDTEKAPTFGGELVIIDVKSFDAVTLDDGVTYYSKSLYSEKVQLVAKEIVFNGKTQGYAISFVSTEAEDRLVATARRTIVNNALWVMLASVIAVYFITERLIHPLRSMTRAAKKFANGDFSSRIAVGGQDEISELAEAFNNMAQSLSNIEKTRNSFLASVSHDLRTPMTTISGFIEGIISGAIPEDKHKYYLGIISDEVKRLSRLVGDLLDISRLESGERKFDFIPFDIAEVARIVLISFEKQIEDKKLDVIFESENDDMPVVGDKDAIHQVLYNLCHNAIKFSKDGGKLAISLTYVENKKVRVSVYDEGQSISREEISLIFDRFYKTDKSRGLDKSGVGLGLYISKTILDAHNEQIHAESLSDNGAEFWFTLPRAEIFTKNTYNSRGLNG